MELKQWVEINQETGQPVTTSLKVAEVFGKEHKNVLRDIAELACSQEFRRLNFEPSYYKNTQNRDMPYYIITKDGFSILAMGYTGARAVEFKERYITAFNQYEGLLKNDDYILNRALQISANRMKALEQKVATQSEQLALQEKVIQEAAPKVEYYESVLQSDGLISATQIAQELGISAVTLNRWLRRDRIIYTVSGTQVLYQPHKDKGFADYKTFTFTDKKNQTISVQHLYWLQPGRKFILDKYGKK